MKVILSLNWDTTIKPTNFNQKESSEPISIIKTSPYKRLKNFIVRKKSGSILVSGQRGAGKSTAVTKTLNDLFKENKVLPIYVNALVLEALSNTNKTSEKETFLNVLSILKSLVKALHKEIEEQNTFFCDKRVKSKLSLLAQKISYTQSIWRYKNTFSTDLSLGGDASIPVKQFIANLGASIKDNRKVEQEYVKEGVPLEEIAQEFSDILNDLRKSKKRIINFKKKKEFPEKIVFVIDELDYYDENKKDILNAIKKVKSLITLSDAVFIFVVGQETYKYSIEVDKYYTTFSDRVFFFKPTGIELSDYLESIKETQFEEQESQSWDIFKWWLISQSEHNFYELISQIKSYSDFDEVENQYYLTVNDLSDKQINLATVEYAIDEIYRHYLHDPKKYHYNETLYNKLQSIKTNFSTWVDENTNEPIILEKDANVPTKEDQINILKAQHSLLVYLHNLSNKDFAINPLAQSTVPIAWADLVSGFSFNTVKKGIKGAVLASEEEFLNTYNNLVKSIASFSPEEVKKIDQINFVSLIEGHSTKFLLNIPPEDAKKTNAGIEEITQKTIIERDRKAIENGFSSLRSIVATNTKLNNYTNGLIVKNEYGNFDPDKIKEGKYIFDNKTASKRFATKLTLFPQDKKLDEFVLSFKTKLSIDSILNVLFFMNEPNSLDENLEEYYMARLETRNSVHSNTRDGFLHKKVKENWNMVQNVIGKKVCHPDTDYNIKITYKNKELSFQKKNINDKRYVTIEKLKISQDIKYIGFGNELSNVEIYDIQIS